MINAVENAGEGRGSKAMPLYLVHENSEKTREVQEELVFGLRFKHVLHQMIHTRYNFDVHRAVHHNIFL